MLMDERTKITFLLNDSATTDQQRHEIGEQLAALGDTRPGVGVHNGLPDMVWLPVAPGGEVTVKRVWMTDDPNEEDRVLLEKPFAVAPFYISKYLVTYAQYQAFVAAADGYHNSLWWADFPEAYHQQPLAEQGIKRPNNPRDHLSWYQSVAFGRWLNHRLQGVELADPAGEGVFHIGQNAEVRLPTEWEWQWAAQNGAEARLFPWGKAQQGYANTAESGLEQAVAVGMYPQGAAACGALDMVGNLMEWCLNNKEELERIDLSDPVQKALRGGDWGYGLNYATCTYCDGEIPQRIDPLNGCRLIVGAVE